MLKNAAVVDTSDFAESSVLVNLKSDVDNLDIDILKSLPNGISSLKSKVDKLDIAKLKTTPIDLSKLSDAVKNEVVKKTECNELVKKFNTV